MEISVIIPAYNEKNNIIPLYLELSTVLNELNKTYEIIFIDDGSTDNTLQEMLKLKEENKQQKQKEENKQQRQNLKIIKFKKNFGQTAAWSAGFAQARGDLIIVMDADLQNDPKDIPLLINTLRSGYDVVSGWRYNRQDSFSKKIFSYFANRLRRVITGEKIHDSGCSLKVYRKECLQNLRLYGEMHRYITALLSWKGYKVGEIKVNHRHRTAGKTKYSTSRVFKGMMDLLLIVFWQKYSARPIHIFGLLGFLSALLGTFSGIIALYFWFSKKIHLSDTFLPNAAIFLVLMGIILLIFGIIADICIKIYYKDENLYLIEEIKDN